MKKVVLVPFVLLFCFAALAFPQPPSKSAEKTYDELLSKLKGGDTSIDYKALRMAYTETKGYSSYGIDAETKAKLFKANSEKKYKEALAVAEEVLKTNYVEMNAHFIAFIAHRELGNSERSDYHRAVFGGLIDSILTGADGKTAKTAYVVISVPEEYVVINYLQYRRGMQALATEDGHKYDILTVTDDKNNTLKLYFNIDIVWKGYEKMFSK